MFSLFIIILCIFTLIIKKHQSDEDNDEEDTEILNPDSNEFSVPDEQSEQPQVMHKITNEESNTFAEVLKETNGLGRHIGPSGKPSK